MKNLTVTIIACVTLVIVAGQVAHSIVERGRPKNTITVTGLGVENFDSDLIVWNGSYSVKNPDLKAAAAQLNLDRETVRNYLQLKGVAPNEMIFSAVTISKEFSDLRDKQGNVTQKFEGYDLGQEVQITSTNIDKIDQVSREVTGLIDAGIEFRSERPMFYYSKLSDLKVKMIASASKDARTRAETIAKNANSKLGRLRTASMGVFQITAQNSSEEFSWGGAYNTSAKKKTAEITMKMQFEIE
jgi:uncharacterized protein